MIVGCVVEYAGKILLCRRAIEPRHGYWTLPAGFMENGESTADGARRETLEEAGANVLIDAPFALINIARINQVHLFYRGRLTDPIYACGEESLEVELFEADDIPWADLAFTSVAFCLKRYLEDRQHGHFNFHETDLAPSDRPLIPPAKT
jgi:ADP-ribose pyrophosphatase YjhB (NUDIX family)